MRNQTSIISPIGSGSGAYIVHKLLESRISGYQVIPYHPYRTLFPPSLLLIGRFKNASLIHTTPDYAIFNAQKNIPLVLTFHGYALDQFLRDFSSTLQNIHCQTDLKLFTKLSVRKADCITAVSHFIADLAKQDLQAADNIRIIYNGVDHSMFTPGKQNHFQQAKKINVLFCGKPTKRKGAQWLVPIADRLDCNIHILYISGLHQTKTLIDHSKLTRLSTVPYHKMPSVYQDADILLFPTVREGFGMAAAEAMACGLPVVATNCSSLPELIDDGKGGFLCPLGDVDAFAEKINLLADNPKLRSEMGDYNRAKVEKMFTLDRMVGEYQQLFEEVLSK